MLSKSKQTNWKKATNVLLITLISSRYFFDQQSRAHSKYA